MIREVVGFYGCLFALWGVSAYAWQVGDVLIAWLCYGLILVFGALGSAEELGEHRRAKKREKDRESLP